MKSKKLFVATIVIGVIFTLFLIFLVPVLIGRLFKDSSALNLLFVLLPILFSVLFVVLLALFISRESLMRTIQLENQNILGRKSAFNNLYVKTDSPDEIKC